MMTTQAGSHWPHQFLYLWSCWDLEKGYRHRWSLPPLTMSPFVEWRVRFDCLLFFFFSQLEPDEIFEFKNKNKKSVHPKLNNVQFFWSSIIVLIWQNSNWQWRQYLCSCEEEKSNRCAFEATQSRIAHVCTHFTGILLRPERKIIGTKTNRYS